MQYCLFTYYGTYCTHLKGYVPVITPDIVRTNVMVREVISHGERCEKVSLICRKVVDFNRGVWPIMSIT